MFVATFFFSLVALHLCVVCTFVPSRSVYHKVSSQLSITKLDRLLHLASICDLHLDNGRSNLTLCVVCVLYALGLVAPAQIHDLLGNCPISR